mgnify:CR=1 FL=1
MGTNGTIILTVALLMVIIIQPPNCNKLHELGCSFPLIKVGKSPETDGVFELGTWSKHGGLSIEKRFDDRKITIPKC